MMQMHEQELNCRTAMLGGGIKTLLQSVCMLKDFLKVE